MLDSASVPDTDVELLQVLGTAIVVATAIELLARYVRMPSIVSYIVAGLVVGPLMGWISPDALEHGALEILGELGIVLLMFLVGLELSLDRIKQVGKVAVVAGLGQVVFTAAGGLGLCRLLGFDWMESVFLATALTFSSTVVVVKLLDQKGELDSLYGRIAVGIFLVQDLVVIIVLTFLAGLSADSAPTASQIAVNVGKAFGGMTLLLVGALVASRYLLPRPFNWAARSPRTLFVWSVAWCFLIVSIAEVMALSAEVGAFLAGMSIAQLGCAHELRRRVHPLMSFFIVLFFVSLGAQMQLGAATDQWLEASVLALFVIIGNPFIFMLIIARSGYSERTAFMTSVTVAQISEFSFIFAAAGVSAGLIGGPILSVVGLVGLVTIAASAYLILYNAQLYERLSKWNVLRVFGGARKDDASSEPEVLTGHVIVIGMNELGRELVRTLHEAGDLVLAVDTDPGKLEGVPSKTKVGDAAYRSFLEDARYTQAALVVSCLQIENVNRLLTYRCRAAGVPVAVYAIDARTYEESGCPVPDHVIEPKARAAEQLQTWLRDEGLAR